MNAGQIAGLVAAGAFLMLVIVLAVPILRLRHTVDAATQAINDLNDRTGPILGNANTTIQNVNTALVQIHTTLDGVNLQLAKIDTITGHAAECLGQRRQPRYRGLGRRGEPAGQGRRLRVRRPQGRVRAAARLGRTRRAGHAEAAAPGREARRPLTPAGVAPPGAPWLPGAWARVGRSKKRGRGHVAMVAPRGVGRPGLRVAAAAWQPRNPGPARGWRMKAGRMEP